MPQSPIDVARGRARLIGCLAPVVLSCVVMICALPVVAFRATFGAAELVVYHPPSSSPAELLVDGAAHGSLGLGFTTFSLPNGTRDLAIRQSGTVVQRWSLEHATGLDEYLVSTEPSICFAELDVSTALYRVGRARRSFGSRQECQFGESDVSLIATFPSSISEMSGVSGAYSIRELPREVEGFRPVFLIVPVACAELPMISAAMLLRRELGCD